MIEQEREFAELYRRRDDGLWSWIEFESDEELELESIGFKMPVPICMREPCQLLLFFQRELPHHPFPYFVINIPGVQHFPEPEELPAVHVKLVKQRNRAVRVHGIK